MILLDDNFATLVAAVEEGRVIYQNIRRFLRYLLSCNTGEVLTMFLGMLMGMPVILTPIQLLLVNLVTDGFPAISLGLEPAEPSVMRRPPRAPDESIFSEGLMGKILFRGVIIGLTTLGVFSLFAARGEELVLCRTAALLTLVMTQLFHVFECRSETKGLLELNPFGNPLLLAAGIFSAACTAAAVWVPPAIGSYDCASHAAAARIGSALLAGGAHRFLVFPHHFPQNKTGCSYRSGSGGREAGKRDGVTLKAVRRSGGRIGRRGRWVRGSAGRSGGNYPAAGGAVPGRPRPVLRGGSVARRRLNLIDARTGWTGGKILRMKTKKRKKKSVEILILPGELQRSRRVAAPAPGVNPSRRLSFGADSEKPDKKHVFPPCMLLPRPKAPPVSKMRQLKRMARDLYDLMILPGGPSVKA